jgi:MFS family permease
MRQETPQHGRPAGARVWRNVSVFAFCQGLFMTGQFLLFCAGAVLIGVFNGFSQYYRFAAADSAPEALRSRAISWVLAGGVVAAFAGPNLANFSRELLAPAQYAGAYASLVGLQIAAVLLLLFVRIPRLTEAQQHDPGRPLGEIMRQPAFEGATAPSLARAPRLDSRMESRAMPQGCGDYGFHPVGVVALAGGRVGYAGARSRAECCAGSRSTR